MLLSRDSSRIAIIAILDVIAKVVYALVLLKDKRVFERRNRSEREYEPIGAAR